MPSSIFRPLTISKNKLTTACLLSLSLVGMVGCQTVHKTSLPTTNDIITQADDAPTRLQSFYISGKIGVITPATPDTNAQAGSAFYVWAQQDERFSIDLTGALGIGHTVIEYNGKTATLVSEKTGTLQANSPEELLKQATGWQAPISQLPYWISAQPAPSDDNLTYDEQNRLATATNGDWEATFTYANTASNALPSKIKIQRADGHKVTLTINHQPQVSS